MKKSIHHSKYRSLISSLREKREQQNITQASLAKQLNVSQAMISKIESCDRRLDVIELMSYCNAIKISFIEFIKEYSEE